MPATEAASSPRASILKSRRRGARQHLLLTSLQPGRPHPVVVLRLRMLAGRGAGAHAPGVCPARPAAPAPGRRRSYSAWHLSMCWACCGRGGSLPSKANGKDIVRDSSRRTLRKYHSTLPFASLDWQDAPRKYDERGMCWMDQMHQPQNSSKATEITIVALDKLNTNI